MSARCSRPSSALLGDAALNLWTAAPTSLSRTRSWSALGCTSGRSSSPCTRTDVDRRTGGDAAGLSNAKRRADKEIAHVTLSRSRLANEARTGATGRIYSEVMEVVRAFVTCVDPATVVPDWHKRIWQTIPGFVRGREHFYRPPNVPTQGLPPR